MKKRCLNGYWDFMPVFGEPPKKIPTAGWSRNKYLVPSFWTKPRDAVRMPGEKYYKDVCDYTNQKKGFVKGQENLADAWEYPLRWTQTRSGLVRRTVDIPHVAPGRRYALLFEAVAPKSTLYVNGRQIAQHQHPSLPFEVDVTQNLVPGPNQVALLIQDYDRNPHNNRTKVPTGNWIPLQHSGVWQDVWLVERADVHVSDVTITTSTRSGKIEAAIVLQNCSDRARTVRVDPCVVLWNKRPARGQDTPVLRFKPFTVTLKAGRSTVRSLSRRWRNAQWWSPESPTLYELRTTLTEKDRTVHEHAQRFGFREVWIQGHHLMLNDHPIHLFSDWGHKATPYHMTEQWIRQWFGMIRDCNMNHSRLHTHPHPKLVLDIADEEGILITGETGLHGSFDKSLDTEDPVFWENTQDHIRRFVRRDKNHPCVIMWSVENEMRWGGHGTAQTKENLPRMRRLFNQLDPTRPAYHEGDSSMWNEANDDQPVISRHYGKECSGIGWWDRSKPLHAGEMSFYHYAGPNNQKNILGDRGFNDFRTVVRAAAVDTKLIIETGRTLGVCCFGPWNLSCLENLRMERKKILLKYKDLAAPGVKPLVVNPHSAEFEFWKRGKGYTPGWSFAIQKRAFRPLAVIDRSRCGLYFCGAAVHREIFVVNDTSENIKGTLVAEVVRGRNQIARLERVLTVPRGDVRSVWFNLRLPKELSGRLTYSVRFVAGGEVADSWKRTLRVCKPVVRVSLRRDVAVLGSGSLAPTLKSWGIRHRYVNSLKQKDLGTDGILILEKNAVEAGSSQNREVQNFVRRGGRCIVMEQEVSLFPSVAMENSAVQSAFVRAYGHRVLAGLGEADLSFWGEDPYPLLAGNSFVAHRLYVKDDGARMLPILDAGEGGFGATGSLTAALWEAREGTGVIVACQMRISEKLGDVPAALRLLGNMLSYVDSYSCADGHGPVLVDGNGSPTEAVKQARSGASVIVEGIPEKRLSSWSRALGVKLTPAKTGDVYQLVRVKDDPVLAGVSNHDTCGVESYAYTGGDCRNTTVGPLFFKPEAGLECLLETGTAGLLKEMFVHGGKTEILRAHTLSRFLFAEKQSPAVGLGRVRLGSGEVILNQFGPRGLKRRRFRRLTNRLRANLGGPGRGSILAGPAVPHGRDHGTGCAQKAAVVNRTLSRTEKDMLLGCMHPTQEHIQSSGMVALEGWNVQPTPGGTLSARGLDLSQDVYVYYPINSPKQRRNGGAECNAPNPEALTVLDMLGEGTVDVCINARTTAQGVRIGPKGLAIGDIELEMWFNYILIRWRPASEMSTLSTAWRTITGRPESGFDFSLHW